MKQLFLTYLVCQAFCLYSQTDSALRHFDDLRNKQTKNSMIVLTSWAGANVVGSVAGYALTNSYEEKQFYIMNGAWGVINLGFALPGLLGKPKYGANVWDVQRRQTNVEKLFLANAALDLAYIMRGTYYLEKAKHQTDALEAQRSRGFGNAIVIQGAGLFLFDLTMTFLSNRNRKKHLDPFLKNATISFTGNSVGLGYRFN